MNPADLTALLEERDITLSLRLVVDAPRGAFTEDLRANLLEHKPALMHYLAREAHWRELSTWRWADPSDEDEPPDILADEPPLD